MSEEKQEVSLKNPVQVATKLGHQVYQFIVDRPGCTSLQISEFINPVLDKNVRKEIDRNLASLLAYSNIYGVKSPNTARLRYFATNTGQVKWNRTKMERK